VAQGQLIYDAPTSPRHLNQSMLSRSVDGMEMNDVCKSTYEVHEERNMKKIGVVSIPREASHQDYPFKVFYEKIGMNTGNYMFTEAMFRQIKGDLHHIGFGYDPEVINREFDHIVIPAANWLNSYSQWDWLTDIVDKTEIPVTTIGIGLQADSLNIADVKISDSSVRLAKMLARKSPYISTRGDFTRDWLNSIGIENVITTGCPSLYMRLQESQESYVTRSVEDNFVIQSTRYGINSQFLNSTDINRTLFALAARCDSYMIYQSEIEEIICLLYGVASNENNLQERLHLMANLYALQNKEEMIDYIIRRGKVFLSIDEWSSFVRGTRGVLGTRLHGAILSLNSDVPAILIPHDSRTKELIEFAKIPSISPDDAVLAGSRSDIMKNIAEANIKQFRETRDWNAAIYRAFLAACNLPYQNESLF
jgi:hypothetical protein